MDESQTLYEGGRDGYHTYRIPSLLMVANGEILAFCEGRRDHPHDTGQIDLLMKRSTDGGRNWSSQEVVLSEPEMTCGNPCPVLDRETGVLVMAFCKNRSDGPQKMTMEGKAPRTVWTMQSPDHGRTWSQPVEITGSVKKSSWTWYGTGPGHGLQLTDGRLIIPCVHTTGLRFDETDRFGAHLIYSDDHGATWRIGAVLSYPGDECAAVQLDDGSVYLNSRTKKPCMERSFGISRDGGLSFLEEGPHPELPEPKTKSDGCQGSLLQVPAPEGEGTWLIFCNPACPSRKRRGLTLQVSRDQGRTWQAGLVLNPGPSGYSDLALTGHGAILCLFEAGEARYSERLVLVRLESEQVFGACPPVPF